MMIRENLSGLTALLIGSIVVMVIFSVGKQFTGGDLTGFVVRIFLLLIPILLIATGIWLLIWEDDEDENTRITIWIGSGVVLFGFLSALGAFSTAQMGVIAGDQVGILQRVSPLTIAAGAIIGVLLGSYDILQHRERKELKASQEQADRRLERISVLNRVLRHDIRNSISVISGYLEKLDTESAEENQAEEMIREHIDEILHLSDQSREIEELIRRDTPKIDEIDISAIIQQKCHELGECNEGVEIEYTGPESAVIESTPLISSVINNATDNAVEHNDQPVAKIDVTLEEVVHNDYAYKITVADNGPGLPEREKQVFKRDRETSLKHSDGMGIWLIRWISREAGGEVTVSDNGSRGTKITVYLPEVHPEIR